MTEEELESNYAQEAKETLAQSGMVGTQYATLHSLKAQAFLTEIRRRQVDSQRRLFGLNVGTSGTALLIALASFWRSTNTSSDNRSWQQEQRSWQQEQRDYYRQMIAAVEQRGRAPMPPVTSLPRASNKPSREGT